MTRRASPRRPRRTAPRSPRPRPRRTRAPRPRTPPPPAVRRPAPRPEPTPLVAPPLSPPAAAAPPPPITPATPPPTRPPRRAWLAPLVAVPLLFTASLLIYADDLDRPAGIVFDEAHYVPWARNFTQDRLINPGWQDPRPYNFEHPPFAKYLIAGGLAVFGDDEFGWRIASATVGAVGVAGVFVLGRRLFRSDLAGLAAAGFLLLDPMYFLHARVAMLDVFPAALTVWALALAAYAAPASRIAAGAVYGLAIASKYSALYVLPVFFLLQLGQTRSTNPRVRLSVASALGVLIPVLVWWATYAPYFVIWNRMGGLDLVRDEFILVLLAGFGWNFAAGATHDFGSPPLWWIPMIKPVWYAVATFPDGRLSYVYSVGNPALWWPATVAAIWIPLRQAVRAGRAWIRGPPGPPVLDRLRAYRLRFAASNDLLIAALLFLASYLPWFLLQRLTFMFYATLMTPFFALLGAGLFARLWHHGPRARVVAVAFGTLVALFFAAWFPLASGAPMTRDHYEVLRYLVPWMQTHPAS